MNTEKAVKVLIVDDYEASRAGLSLIFETLEGVEVVGMATNGGEAIILCEETRPDVVIMDLNKPEIDGIAAIRIIKKEFPEIQIVFMSGFTDRSKVLKALEAGAATSISREACIDELAKIIQKVKENQIADWK